MSTYNHSKISKGAGATPPDLILSIRRCNPGTNSGEDCKKHYKGAGVAPPEEHYLR